MKIIKQAIVGILSLFLSNQVLGEGKTFRISGSTPELSEGIMLVVTEKGDGTDTLGQGAIVKGHFRIEGEIEAPCVALIKVAGYEGGFVFLLDTDVPYEMELHKSGKSLIKGGKQQELLTDYQRRVDRANQEMAKVKQEISEASRLKHFRTANELQGKLEKIRSKAQKELDATVAKHRGELFAAYILTLRKDPNNLAVLQECYNSLTEKEKGTAPGRFIATRIQILEKVEVDAIAPDFTLQTPEGKKVSLKDMPGKLKIIDFWASWCGPCRLENPNMVQLYQDYRDKGLSIISVSLDTKKEAWTKAIEKDGLTWTHVSSLEGWQCEVVKKYGIDAVPAIFVLDENNHIIAKQLRGEKLRALVAEQLH